jgi:hypothetical protein
MTDELHDASPTLVADGGVLIAGVEYVCRVCEHEHTIYVSPVLRDGQPTLDFDSRHRVVEADCEDCAEKRPHVAREVLER